MEQFGGKISEPEGPLDELSPVVQSSQILRKRFPRIVDDWNY